ncbi:MAG: heme o synthase [Vicinamibacterales bacterium]
MSDAPTPSSSATASADVPAAARTPSAFADYVTLTKPRLNLLVVMTTCVAYYAGRRAGAPWAEFVHTVVGTTLVAAGASALNQVWERDTDKRMRRTRRRPLPDARLATTPALLFGLALTLAGIAELWAWVNPLSALVAFVTMLTYVAWYTPLKLRSSLSTIVGAIPGALPALIGWAAATASLSLPGWSLFAIVFCWQMPHFLAIAWMHRDDYAHAGMPLLPVIEPDGRSTGRQAVLYAAATIPVSLLPTAVGLAGPRYLAAALVLGAIVLWLAFEFAATRSHAAARRLFFATIIYLPLLWLVLVLDSGLGPDPFPR